MEIIRAETMGMCFGVRRALMIARGVARPAEVTINGPLVHNRTVGAELARRGFREIPCGASPEAIATRKVLVTAHGISDAARRRLEETGHTLIDATCPQVMRAQEAARKIRGEGRFLLVIGRRGHAEVRGILDDAENRSDAAVIESIDDVRDFDRPSIGVVCQTTSAPGKAAALIDAIRRRNPASDVRVVETICGATRARQNAVAALLPRVDLLVVVGGRDSENTRRLVEIAEAHRKPVLHVEEAAEIKAAAFRDRRVVGLTAGASTPDEVIEAVRRRLEALPYEESMIAPARPRLNPELGKLPFSPLIQPVSGSFAAFVGVVRDALCVVRKTDFERVESHHAPRATHNAPIKATYRDEAK